MTHVRRSNPDNFRPSPAVERKVRLGAPAPEVKWYFIDLLKAWGIDPAAWEVGP